MTTTKRFASTVGCSTALALALLTAMARPAAGAQQTECTNSSGSQFKAVALSAPRTAAMEFSASGGQLDPVPLLETEIKTGPACVVVHFSAQADPLDNAIVFQASIDDIPMEGHVLFPYISPTLPTPVVFDPEETNLNLSRMVAYTFFLKVGAGVHTVRIRFAGCCSANPDARSGLVRAAIMSVHY